VWAQVLLRLIVALAPAKIPRLDVVRLAGAPLGAALGVTVVAVVLFGLLPALGAARSNLASPLRLDWRSGSESRLRRHLRQSLVASQIALALMLLAGAGLLARSLQRMLHLDLGYTAGHLAILQFSWRTVTEPRL